MDVCMLVYVPTHCVDIVFIIPAEGCHGTLIVYYFALKVCVQIAEWRRKNYVL